MGEIATAIEELAAHSDGFLDEQQIQNFMIANQEQEAATVLEQFDADGTGKLEGKEIAQLMNDGDVNNLMWRSYDVDTDGKLSSIEIYNLANREQEGSSDNEEEYDKYSWVTKDFARFDSNNDDCLDEKELHAVMDDKDLKAGTWRAHDTDKDGKLSKTELIAFAKQTIIKQKEDINKHMEHK